MSHTIQRLPGITVQTPTSTAILQDMVVSFRDLDQMERTLETNQPTEPIQGIPSKLEHIIAIYNENVGTINSKCDNFKREFVFWEYPTFEFYCAHTRDSESDLNARAKYENKKAVKKQNHQNELHEICKLAADGILHDSLKLKIERVIQRCMVYNLPVKELPQLKTLWPKVYEYTTVVPTLRQPHEGANKSSPRGTSNSPFLTQARELIDSLQTVLLNFESTSSATTTTTTTNTTPSTLTITTVPSTQTVTQAPQQEVPTPAAVSPDSAPDLAKALEMDIKPQPQSEPQKTEEVTPPQPVPAPTSVTANIFIDLDLYYNGDSIGICHEPTWGAKPVAFVRGTSRKNWQGEIPIGKEFKFVIVQSHGVVLKWENLSFNRRVDTGTVIQFPDNDANFS